MKPTPTRLRWGSSWVIALCFTSLAGGMDPGRALSQYTRNRWGAEQGFPGGAVYSIAGTSDGYLWIGAEKGLIRFDGVSFHLFNHANTPALSAGPVLDVAASVDGDLWIRTQSPGLLRMHGGIFEDVPLAPEPIDTPIPAMFREEGGDIVFAALTNFLFRYDGRELSRRHFKPDHSNVLVVSLAESPDGTIWLGTRDSGLFSLGKDAVSAVARGAHDRINCLLPAGDKELWIGTDKGLMRWDGTRVTEDGVGEPLKRVQILSMHRDRDSNVWVGTANGLARINAKGVSAPDNRDGNPVTALFEDREGNLWTGGPQGVERFRDSPFLTYATYSRQPENNGAIYVDDQNRTWFAPSDGGLYWLRGTQLESVSIAGLNRDSVYSISGSGEDLWVGRQRGGLTHLVTSGSSFTATTYTTRDGLPRNTVYTVARSRDGSVWAGTLNGGVSRFSNGAFTTYTSTNGLASDSISSILEGSGGTTWFATANGLSAFSDGRWRAYTGREGLPSVHLNCLTEDSDGVLWIGTAEGLAFLRSGRVQIPDQVPEPLREEVLGIAADAHGGLWIATAGHVLRVNRYKLLKGHVGDGDLRDYGPEDGLLGTEGIKRDRSVIADKHGRIWFSMNRGISEVDPERLAGNPAPAIVHIQTISADDSPMDLSRAVQIPGRSRRVIFTYRGISLSTPERIQYRYRLDGLDHAWSPPTTTTEAGYSNLRPGPYRFRVMASKGEGLWNGGEAVGAIEVEPMFWQTWWFYIAGILACGLAITALYRYRMHQLSSQLSLRFEERLSERTRIAQELHDTLLQGVLSASMQLHVAADQLTTDSPARRPLENVLQLMKQVIDEGRNTVQGLRSSYSGPPDLGPAFSAITSELAVPSQVAFRVVVEGQPRPLHPVLRDEVYRIGREALMNAFRHSRATTVEVELQYASNKLRISVRDNGCGINREVLRSGREGHWGLPGMRERAERIGAQLHVWSRAAAGTEVELSIPGQVAFQFVPPSRLRQWFRRNLVRSWAGDARGTRAPKEGSERNP